MERQIGRKIWLKFWRQISRQICLEKSTFGEIYMVPPLQHRVDFRISGREIGQTIRWKFRFVKSVCKIQLKFRGGRIYDVGKNFGFLTEKSDRKFGSKLEFQFNYNNIMTKSKSIPTKATKASPTVAKKSNVKTQKNQKPAAAQPGAQPTSYQHRQGVGAPTHSWKAVCASLSQWPPLPAQRQQAVAAAHWFLQEPLLLLGSTTSGVR